MADGEWGQRAACRGHTTALWFPPGSDYGSDNRYIDIEPVVRRTCSRCPVRVECFEYALMFAVDGVWAGTLPVHRADIRKARGITPVSVHCGSLGAGATLDDDIGGVA